MFVISVLSAHFKRVNYSIWSESRLRPDCWATEVAQPARFFSLRLDSTVSKLSACDPDALKLFFVSSISINFCSSSASVFLLS